MFLINTYHRLFCTCFFCAYFNFKTIYLRWKGPKQELYSSSRRTAVVPLFKNYMQFFLVIFLGWVMLLHPQATSTDHGGPRTSDLSIKRRRRNHFTTASHYMKIPGKVWLAFYYVSKLDDHQFLPFPEEV